MEITEIENLSFDELKAQKADLIAAARKCSMEDLATRYVQARTDAKQRDEKLAEQARTLDSLNAGFEAQKAQIEGLKADAATTVAERDQTVALLQSDIAALKQSLASERTARTNSDETAAGEIGRLNALLQAETVRSGRLRVEAERNHAALHGAAGLINKAIAEQYIETADQGQAAG